MSNIVTTFVHPPIPLRHMDREAIRSGWEPGQPAGFEATEAEAVQDLLELEAERNQCPVCGEPHGPGSMPWTCETGDGE